MKHLKPTTRNGIIFTVLLLAFFIPLLLIAVPGQSSGIPFRSWMRNWLQGHIEVKTGTFKQDTVTGLCDSDTGRCGFLCPNNPVEPNVVPAGFRYWMCKADGWYDCQPGSPPTCIKAGTGSGTPTNIPIDGADSSAIHANVPSEISAITEKATPDANDVVIIEDSTASNAKRKVRIGNFPSNYPLSQTGVSAIAAAWTDKLLGNNGSVEVIVPNDTTLSSLVTVCTLDGTLQNLSCTTDPCWTSEIYVNGADQLTEDCLINGGANSCIQPLTSNNALTAGQWFDVRATTASDTTPTSADCVVEVWGHTDAVTPPTTTTTLPAATNYLNDPNCLGAYLFENASNLGIDSCGGDDTFVLGATAPTQDTTNKQEGSGSLDTTGSAYLTCEAAGGGSCTNIDGRGKSAWTVSAWSKSATTSQWHTTIAQGWDTAGARSYMLRSVENGGGGSLVINNSSNSTVTEASATSTADATWTHYCGTYDGSNITIYKDGVVDCTAGCNAQTGTIGGSTADGHLIIGAGFNSSGATKDFSNGNIDELLIFDRTLAATECCEICRKGKDGLTSDRGAACGTCTLP